MFLLDVAIDYLFWAFFYLGLTLLDHELLESYFGYIGMISAW